MKTLFKIILFASIIYLSSSCKHDVSGVDNPEFKKQMVVHCFLSPNQKIVAFVSYNSEIYGQLNESQINKFDLSGVKAYLSDGTNEAAFYLKNDSFLIDTDQFPIIEGHKYTLRVKDDKTGIEINAQSEVPFHKSCEVVCVDTTYIKIEYGGDFFSKQLAFKTTLNTSNIQNTYIRIKNYCTVYWRNKGDLTKQYTYEYPLHVKDCFIKPSMKLFQYEVTSYGLNFDAVDSAFYNVRVFQYNYEYYTYKKSLDDYTDEESFLKEISPVYTNINGGLGFFGGYTMQEFKMKLNKDMVENK